MTAVGDANGTVDHLSAATGTVLATDQSITTQSEGTATGERLTGLIEISTDVVSGDSGGATYDADGRGRRHDHRGVERQQRRRRLRRPDRQGAAGSPTTWRAASPSARYDYGYPAFLGVGLGRPAPPCRASTRAPRPPAPASAPATRSPRSTAPRCAPRRPAAQRRSRPTPPATPSASPGPTRPAPSHTATVTLVDGPVDVAAPPRGVSGACASRAGAAARAIGVPTKPNSSRSRRSM